MSPTQQSEAELKHLSEVADAELGVAEELGWPFAGFAALAAYLRWDSWLITVSFGVAVYALAIYRYRRRASRAEDNYYRVARLGKYAGTRAPADS